jgi:hypothetical protein
MKDDFFASSGKRYHATSSSIDWTRCSIVVVMVVVWFLTFRSPRTSTPSPNWTVACRRALIDAVGFRSTSSSNLSNVSAIRSRNGRNHLTKVGLRLGVQTWGANRIRYRFIFRSPSNRRCSISPMPAPKLACHLCRAPARRPLDRVDVRGPVREVKDSSLLPRPRRSACL